MRKGGSAITSETQSRHTYCKEIALFINCERYGQETMKYLRARFAFKHSEESKFTGFVLRLLLSLLQRESKICMQGVCLNNLQLISI